jgi:hypothetical protein
MIRQTHTYANLPVSQSTFNEVRHLLQEARYDHLLEDKDCIPMQGIALVVEEPKQQPPLMISDLRKDIEHAINRYSAENGSNTPDFILAQYLVDALCAYDKAVTAREKWYGREPVPVPPDQAPASPVGREFFKSI